MAEKSNPINCTVMFGIRNDKNRGLLIETLTTPNSDVYFFKYHDQPLARHCEQMQVIVRKANVVRSKKLQVDLTEFLHEYSRAADNSIVFKAAKLNSVTQQIEKVHEMRLNKELGAIKRKITMANNKQAKIDEKNQKIRTKLYVDEQKFQIERVKRINELLVERCPKEQQVSGNESGQEPQAPGFGHFSGHGSGKPPSGDDVKLPTDDESDMDE